MDASVMALRTARAAGKRTRGHAAGLANHAAGFKTRKELLGGGKSSEEGQEDQKETKRRQCEDLSAKQVREGKAAQVLSPLEACETPRQLGRR